MTYTLPFKPTDAILEIGGGDQPTFHPNLDVRKLPQVDLVCDLEEPWPVANASFDGVFGKFVAEHVGWRKSDFFASECARVLRAGGIAVLIVPNTLEQCKKIVRENKVDADAACLLYGGQETPGWNQHKTAFSPDYAIELYKKAGFSEVVIDAWPGAITDMVIIARKGKATVSQDLTPQNITQAPWYKELDSKLPQAAAPFTPAPAPVPAAPQEIRRLSSPRFDWIRGQIPPGSKVIDIGCSDAAGTVDLPDCLWVDQEPYEKLRDAALKLGITPFPQSKFLQSDIAKLPVVGSSFDVALVCDVLEHVFNTVEVLKEAMRVARRVVVTVPNEAGWAPENKPFTNPVHIRYYTRQALEADIKNAAPAGATWSVDTLDFTGWSFFTAVIDTGVPAVKPKPNPDAFRHEFTSPGSKLRVGIVSTQFFGCPPKGYSGLEMVVWDLACGLAYHGHEVTLFGPEGSQAPPGGRVVVTGPALNAVAADWQGSERAAMETYKNFASQLDILHGNNWFGYEYGVKRINPHLKVCHTHHGGLDSQWWGKPPFPLNLIAISNWMVRVYESQGQKARPVYNGIDLARYPFQAKKGNRLLFVGRFDRLKQPHVAIEVAKKTGLGLDLVGGTFVQDPGYVNEIKAACDGQQICFYPDVTHEFKVAMMQNAKALLFPSKMGEPFGLVACEAMACGTPVIALNDGAISEVVSGGLTGYICSDADNMTLAVHGISKINPEDCRRRVENNFTRERMAANYIDLYRAILEGREW